MARTQREELVEELERRIEEIEGLDDEALGRFTPLDWTICVVCALALPHLALLWFAG